MGSGRGGWERPNRPRDRPTADCYFTPPRKGLPEAAHRFPKRNCESADFTLRAPVQDRRGLCSWAWACGVMAAQFLAKVQVRVRIPPGPFLLTEDVSQGRWRVRRAGYNPPQSNLILGAIVSIIVVLPWQGTDYCF